MLDLKAYGRTLPILTAVEVLFVVVGAVLAPISTGTAIIVLLAALPIALVCCGALGGWYAHPLWFHPLVVAVATAIMVMAVLNSSALVYIAYFMAANLMGFVIGMLARRTLNDRDGITDPKHGA